MTQEVNSGGSAQHAFVKNVHGVRYQVADVARAVTFYTQHLGFTLRHQQLPAFAAVSLGGVQLLLSGPGASRSRPMPNGTVQEPGGWNRIVLRVEALPAWSPSCEIRDSNFATRRKPARVVARFKWRILTEIPLSCSNHVAECLLVGCDTDA